MFEPAPPGSGESTGVVTVSACILSPGSKKTAWVKVSLSLGSGGQSYRYSTPSQRYINCYFLFSTF
jgi:hypothetical protein